MVDLLEREKSTDFFLTHVRVHPSDVPLVASRGLCVESGPIERHIREVFNYFVTCVRNIDDHLSVLSNLSRQHNQF